jgi:hypothetical protein
MTLSRIYQVKILIYHNKSNYINKINVWEGIIPDTQIEVIRLGQINEEHYFPILELPDELKNQEYVIDEILKTDISYSKYSNKFKKWAKFMIESISSSYSNTDLNKIDNNISKIDNNISKIDNNLSKIDNNKNLSKIDNNKNLSKIGNNKNLSKIDNNKNTKHIMKTNDNLSPEQIEDYNQISNIDFFDIL